jgi:type VI protein secretion system component Hcp
MGITRPSGDPCGPAGVRIDNIVVGKHTDSSTVPLFQHAADGAVIPKVDITLVNPGGKSTARLLHYTITNAVVAPVRTSWAGSVPTEEITLAFSRICWESFTQKADGSEGPSTQACADVAP